MTNDTYRIVVIDDLRIPAEGGGGIEVELHKTPAEGLAALQAYHDSGEQIDELWLDHDMGFDDTGLLDIWPVVSWLEETAFNGSPLNVVEIIVHTSNPYGGQQMVAGLGKQGYRVGRGELPLAK